MSKIGKKSIIIPQGVDIKVDGRNIEIKGQGGSLAFVLPYYVKTEIKDKELLFSVENNSKQARANWGTARSLVNNAVLGVTKGYEKLLEIEGIGYRAVMDGANIIFSLGYSHPVKFEAPQGIKLGVEKNVIKVSGIDKDLVGKTASKIRALKKIEPYKGKGIRYKGEIVRRKVGKKVAGAGAK
jgi:large subunit ribosomal protein L6